MTTKKNRKFSMVKQQGLVLFFALIALVAMSLAAAALIRSVDSTVLVAGNLAFKQAATLSADASIANASNYINTNGLTLGTNNSTSGYYASTTNDTASANYLDLRADSTWTNLKSRLATGTGIDANGKDTSGNTIRYVVQRMCRSTGVPAQPTQNCLAGIAVSAGNSNKNCNIGGCGNVNTAPSVMYRITSRVTGPKNTSSLMQAYVY
jgi:type IV pilus assembly protein PilX